MTDAKKDAPEVELYACMDQLQTCARELWDLCQQVPWALADLRALNPEELDLKDEDLMPIALRNMVPARVPAVITTAKRALAKLEELAARFPETKKEGKTP